VSRILVLETSPRSLRVIQRCLDGIGYEIVPVVDQDRLRLEIRKHEPDLILASAEVHGGSGLEIVRDLYPECSRPVPVIVYSGAHTLSVLKDITPVELLIGGFLSVPLDPGELVQTVVGLVTPPDPVHAARVCGDLRSEYEAYGLRLDPPTGMSDLEEAPFARTLWAVDHNDWTGTLSLEPPGGGTVTFWFEMGLLSRAASAKGRDLVDTAIAEGRLDPARVPRVELSSEEEELGLLMALRAVGMHEVDGLRKRTLDRLMVEALAQRDGLVHAAADQWSDEPGDPHAVPKLLMRLVADESRRLGERLVEAHPDSIVVIRLPPRQVIRAWGLPAKDRKVVEFIEQARNREISLEQLIRLAVDGDPTQRPRVRALLQLLRTVGYLDFRGKPWDGATSSRIDELVVELHRVSRSNHFEVFGLAPKASDKEIAEKARALARAYHPDTMFEEHARVQEVANALYSRIQEAYEVLKHRERRDAYRAELQSKSKAASGPGAAEPDKALVSLKKGEIKMSRKDYSAAEGHFRDATLLDPKNARAWILLGWTSYLTGTIRVGTASKTIQKGLQLAPTSGDAWYYLGRVATLNKDPERARRRFAKAIEVEPGHVGAQRELRLHDRREGVPNEKRPSSPRNALRGLFSRRKDD
jgi:Flp pilus assembly protein TadD